MRRPQFLFSAAFILCALFVGMCTVLITNVTGIPTIRAATPQQYNILRGQASSAHFARTRQEVRQAATTSTFTSPLLYHAGPVIQSSTTYAIFWEPPTLQDGTPAYVSPTYNSLLQQYFTDVGGSGLSANNTQYYDNLNGHIVNSSTFGGAWVDTSLYPLSGCSDSYTPGNCLSDLQVRNEILKAMSVNGWNSGLTNIFFVYTPKGEGTCQGGECSFANFCAYHHAFTNNNQTILYANIPYEATDLQGCGVPDSPNNGIDADSSINLTSHEHMESVTDPLFTAWYDGSGNEIGDKCGFQFGSVTLDGGLANVEWNGHYYIVQEEYSNAVGGCVITRSVGGSVYVGSIDGNLYALDAAAGSQMWQPQSTGGSTVSSPTIVNGVAYVGSSGGSIYAFNTSTGATMWSSATGGAITSSPTVVNNVVYIGSNSGSVYAFNASTGTPLWSFATGGPITSSPTVVNGVVYVGSQDDSIYAIKATTGKRNWKFQTGGPVTSSPAVFNGVVFAGSDDGNLYAINTYKGTQKWLYTTGGMIDSPLAVSGGVVYAGASNNNLYAVNAATGAFLWQASTGNGAVNSLPVIANKTVYVGSTSGYVYAFSASTGTLTWQFQTNGEVVSSPTLINGVIYIGSWDSYVYALNAKTGSLLWKYQTSGQISSSPKVIDGMLYIGSSDTFVYALWANDGSSIWKYQSGGGVTSSPVVILTSY